VGEPAQVLLHDDDRVHDLAERDLLVETLRPPIKKFGANTCGTRIPNPIAKMMNDLRQSLFEIGLEDRREPAGPLVRGQVAGDVLGKLIRVNFDELNEFCSDHEDSMMRPCQSSRCVCKRAATSRNATCGVYFATSRRAATAYGEPPTGIRRSW